MNPKTSLLLILFVMLTVQQTKASDGERKGFIFGFGLGSGILSIDNDIDGRGFFATGKESKIPFVSNSKIGYAPSNRLLIYWSGKASWFGMTNAKDEKTFVTAGTGALTASYFLKPKSPSLFFSAGLGYSNWTMPFEVDEEPWYGFGLFAGAGYEFVEHLYIEGGISWGNPSNESNGVSSKSNNLLMFITVNFLSY